MLLSLVNIIRKITAFSAIIRNHYCESSIPPIQQYCDKKQWYQDYDQNHRNDNLHNTNRFRAFSFSFSYSMCIKKGEHPSNVSQYLTMNSESLSSLRVTVSSPRHGETEARSLASVSPGGEKGTATRRLSH